MILHPFLFNHVIRKVCRQLERENPPHLLSLSVLLFIPIGLLSGSQMKEPASTLMTTWYVAVDGDDQAAGDQLHPLASIEAALTAARRSDPRSPRTIYLMSGDYEDVHITLTAADSHLTLAAAAGQKPILYGGRKISQWRQDGKWVTADLSGVADRSWDFRSLVVNGSIRPRARYPRAGVLVHSSQFDVKWMSTTGGGWQRTPTEQELTTLLYNPQDIGPWLDVNNAELTLYHFWDESAVGVASIDTSEHRLTFRNRAGHPPGAFAGWAPRASTYVVWNIREGMNEPGQWYLDRSNERLVYWPLPGESINDLTAVAPTTETIIRMEKGLHHVRLEGFTLRCTTTPLKTGEFGATAFSGAISCQGGAHCRFHHLTIEYVGSWGLTVRADSSEISQCIIRHTGAGGIGFDGNDNRLVDNYIHHVGLHYASAIGFIGGGERDSLLHNAFHHTPYSAICYSGKESVIAHNYFDNIMTELDDGGAIYVTMSQNIILRGNVVKGKNGRRAHAYYLDEQATDCTVEGNLAVDTGWPVHNHMAVDCTIRNNVFLDQGDQRLTFPRSSGMRFEKNILISDEITFEIPSGELETGEIPDVIKPFAQATGIDSMPDNILLSRSGRVGCKQLTGYAIIGVIPLRPADNTIFADPHMQEADLHRFVFLQDSPAPMRGILPLDLSQAGPRIAEK